MDSSQWLVWMPLMMKVIVGALVSYSDKDEDDGLIPF
jgi:hypothetical protein